MKKVKVLLSMLLLVVGSTSFAGIGDIAIGTDNAWHVRSGTNLSYVGVKTGRYVNLAVAARDNGDLYFGETDGTTGYLSRRDGDTATLDWLANDTFGTAVTALGVLPSGNIAMGATVNGVGKLYIRNGDTLSGIASNDGYGIINALIVNNDGNIVVACADGQWHIRSGTDLTFVANKTGMGDTLCIAEQTDGDLLFGGVDGRLRLRGPDLSWKLTKPDPATSDPVYNTIRALAVLPNNNDIVMGAGSTLYVLDGSTLVEKFKDDTTFAQINSLDITAEGKIVVGCDDGKLYLRNADLSAVAEDTGYGTINALTVWTERIVTIPNACINPPSMDYNNDCKVDFLDFAELAANWMLCGLERQEECWN